ncbi:hypothetical protein D6817_04260 [Candidatus Pacearchaeota archaeon]|nr:MAG: hypothetical protein D6817_04260 [Candidatus Pacearchaeota archaeon]
MVEMAVALALKSKAGVRSVALARAHGNFFNNTQVLPTANFCAEPHELPPAQARSYASTPRRAPFKAPY